MTAQSLVETITSLLETSRLLMEAAEAEPIAGTRGKVVPASAEALRIHSKFLADAAEELLEIIDDSTPVSVD